MTRTHTDETGAIAGRRPTVVVAGGAAVDRGLLRSQLGRLGWSVVVAAEASAAVYLAAHQRVAAVLVGESCGGVGVAEVVRRLRVGEIDRDRPTPVLAFTGEDDATRDRLRASGADDVVTLPTPARDLAAQLGRWTHVDLADRTGVDGAPGRQPSMR